ncbi:MAG: GNAT family N-acetyltransferase [Deltaproteobacteria bacterium]|nr:GNAT family N-acetyltransferase [Deltaproteobacteria bacterium]
MNELIFRMSLNLLQSDIFSVRKIVESAGRFTSQKVENAVGNAEDNNNPNTCERFKWYSLIAILPRGVNVPIGYIDFFKDPASEFFYELNFLSIENHYQGKGFGSSLLEEVEKLILAFGGSKVKISTHGKFKSIIVFYEKHGYKIYSNDPDHYTFGDSEVLMKKTLTLNPIVLTILIVNLET